MSPVPTCSGAKVPLVVLGLQKSKCLRSPPGQRLPMPKDVADYAGRLFGCQPQENVYTFCFDTRMQLIAVHHVSMGGIAAAPVDPKVLFGGLMATGGTGFVLVHNHPSGIAEPSKDDDSLTQIVRRGAEALGIKFLDHIIIARGGDFYSFATAGRL